MKNLFSLVIYIGIIAGTAKAQSPFTHIPVFDKDLLEGFDEGLMKQAAFSGQFFGDEYMVFMNRAKRDYIISKYNLPVVKNNIFSDVQFKVASATCVNEDFEASP
ncbi:MAG: hypothetical protein ACXVPQ_03825 [Bacteroidia bacterium]